MALLNYTTSISADRTVAEIQAKLAKAGANQILHEYSERGLLNALSFRINTQFGVLTFRLPANIEAVQKILTSYKKRHREPVALDQSARVAWRILKDWVEAQLALIETGMVTVEQVFLPYWQGAHGKTLYEALRDKKFAGFMLEDGK